MSVVLKTQVHSTANTDRNAWIRLPTVWLLAVSLVIAVCPIAAQVQAGAGAKYLLPVGNVAPKNAVKVQVDTRWVDANGYRPVRVELINWPSGPVTADRSFRVLLRPRSRQLGYRSPEVSQYIEMPEGSSTATASLSVPQNSDWQTLEVVVYEDGYLLDDVSTRLNTGTTTGEWSESTPTVLIIDADAPSIDKRQSMLLNPNVLAQQPIVGTPNKLPSVEQISAVLGQMAPYRNMSNRANFVRALSSDPDIATLQWAEHLPLLEILPPNALPLSWIDYTCFDLIYISAADLESMIRDHKERWQALRNWVATGPTLCVYDVPLGGAKLQQLETLIELSPLTGGGDADDALRGWQRADPALAIGPLRGVDAEQAVPDVRVIRGSGTNAGGGGGAGKPLLFALRPLGLGRVVAIDSNEPFDPKPETFKWLLNTLNRPNWIWYQRHGLSLNVVNNDYWNWVVPGVGQAPVNSYLVLITLFVIAIGPVNYVVLRRRRRLYLLLVTVPLGAALATLALFGYAVISDGLGVRARVRSITDIDQHSGQSVSWSRQSYYAGLAPSQGLAYPAHAACYPMEQTPVERPRYTGPSQRLLWDDGQRLLSGYLKSRSTAQFLVVDAARSQRGLRLRPAEGQPNGIQVTNQLETDIDRLLVCDATGQLFGLTELDAGDEGVATVISAAQAADEFQQVYRDSGPAFPPGTSNGSGRNPYRSRNRFYGFSSSSSAGFDAPTTTTSILERALRDALTRAPGKMVPRTYLAITQRPPDVPLGHTRAREEASLHVIRGVW